MCPNARRVSDFLLLSKVEMPGRELSISRSWVGSCGNGIEDMATISAWECSSHLYGPQEFEVHLYLTRSEYETKKIARVDQGLWARSALSPRKANVDADTLSHKAHYNYLTTMCSTREESSTWVLLDLLVFNITLTPTLWSEIIAAQKRDKGMRLTKGRIREGDPRVACFREDAEGTFWFKDRLAVPRREALKRKIFDEAHTLRYSIHPGSTKMYHDLRQQFW
jgi:hypothetical protein